MERRRQLIETALETFSRRGFEGTTTKEIAAAAGVTEAVIFRHFPNKLALYNEVLAYYHQSADFEEWLAELKATMERNDDEGLFRAIATKILRSHREDPRCHRVLLFAALEGHQPGLAFHRELSAPLIDLLVEYVRRRQREGAFREYPAGAILAAMVGMAQHYAMVTRMFGFQSHTPDEQVVETFVRIMMDGIGKKQQ